MSALNDSYRWLDDDGPAFGGPGLEPRWTSSRKDAVATAYAASSRIWFTISHGTLNEIYYPTIDRPQTRDMELLFTDGETFFHEEKRDLEYDFHHVDPDALAVRVVATDLGGRYTVTKEFITDPHHPVVLMNVKIDGDEALLSKLKCYALMAPTLTAAAKKFGALDQRSRGQRCVVAWKNNVSLHFGADCGFTRSSCSYVGSSDGYQDIVTNGKMTWNFGQALNGNLAVMGEIDVARTREFTIAIALGDGHHSALSGMVSLSTPYVLHRGHRAVAPRRLARATRFRFHRQRPPHARQPQHHPRARRQDLLRSFHCLRFHPLGRLKVRRRSRRLSPRLDARHGAVGDEATLACGRIDTALPGPRFYLACCRARKRGSRRTSGSTGPRTGQHQLDEVAFPIMLAWRLWKVDGLGSFDIPALRRRRSVPLPLRPGHAAGTLGRKRRLLALHARRRNFRPALRVRHRRRARQRGPRRVLRGLCRLDRSPPRRVDHHYRGRPPSRGQVPLHAHPSAGPGRAVPQRLHPARNHPHRQPRPGRERRSTPAKSSTAASSSLSATESAAPTTRS